MRQAEKNLRHVIRETLLLLEVSEEGFKSFVMSTDSRWGGTHQPEIESKKKTIGGLIKNGKATLEKLAEIIVDNDLYQIRSSPGIVQVIWAGFLDTAALQTEIDNLLGGAGYREPSSERSSTINAAVVFANLEKTRMIQSAVYWAVKQLAGNQIWIPRSNRPPNLADFVCFNPSRKEIFVKWKEGESDAEKVLKPVEVVNLNLKYAKPLTILSEFDPVRNSLSYNNQVAIVNKIDQFHFGPSVTSTAVLDVLDTPYNNLIIDKYSYYDGSTGKRSSLEKKVKIMSSPASEIDRLVNQNPWLNASPQTSYEGF